MRYRFAGGVTLGVLAGVSGLAVAQPVNDLCVNAISLTEGINEPLTFGTETQTASASCGGAETGGDIWYSYTNDTGCPVDATISTTPLGFPLTFDTTLAIFDVCGGAEIACNDDAMLPLLLSRVTVPVTPGDTIAIRVGRKPGDANGAIRVDAVIADADSDGDGVLDCQDNCPNDTNVVNTDTGDAFATLRDAVFASSDGDTLELGPCSLFESSLTILDRDLTIRGRGMDATVINAADNSVILSFGQGANVVLEDLSIRDDQANAPSNAPIRVQSPGTRVTMRRVELSGHTNSNEEEQNVAVVDSNATLRLESCRVVGNGGPGDDNLATVTVDGDATLEAINTLFAGNAGADHVLSIGENGDERNTIAIVINCTFADNDTTSSRLVLLGRVDPDTTISNCASDRRLTGFDSGPNNVFPGATGSNIDATPVFVDAANGDYRLASGTPGVDAGDPARYFAVGGGGFDGAGVGRIFDDPNATNADPQWSPIDMGAFELQAAADPTPNPCPADIALPFGVLDLGDIDAFIQSFQAGCP